MTDVKLGLGDTAWFHDGGEEMVEGEVVLVFSRYGPQYVIEVQTAMDPAFYVRDPLAVSDDPDKPIGLLRK